MNELKASHPLALHFLMTEDLYLLNEEEVQEVSKEVTEAPADATPEPAYFEYLGENNRYSLILVSTPDHPVIAPQELEALSNILKAKKQDLNDVAIVNINKYPQATFDDLKTFFACNALVLFGINPMQIHLQGIQSNQIKVHEGTKVLATFSFAEMLSNVEKKRAFWDEMKKL
jgi:hypothetical protein